MLTGRRRLFEGLLSFFPLCLFLSFFRQRGMEREETRLELPNTCSLSQGIDDDDEWNTNEE